MGRHVYETASRLIDRGHSVSVLTRRRGDVPVRETIGGVRVARYDLSVANESAPTIAVRLRGAARRIQDHLDALLWSLDATPKTVAAVTDERGEGVDVNSALAATLERDGANGSGEGGKTITASVGGGDGTDKEPDEGPVIWGTDGHVRYEDGELTVFEDGVTYEGDVEGNRDFVSLTRRKLSDFFRAVEDGTEPTVPGSFGLQVTALTEAAYEAAETGETVDVRAKIRQARESQTPMQVE